MIPAIRMSYLEQVFCRPLLESPVALRRVPREAVVSLVTVFRARARTQLQQMKRRMLYSTLEEAPDAGLFKPLCGAANQAAELAWETGYPLLLFPCLFEELAENVCAQAATMRPAETADCAISYQTEVLAT